MQVGPNSFPVGVFHSYSFILLHFLSYNWHTYDSCSHLQAEFECINTKKVKKKDYKNSGVICIKRCQVCELYLSHDASSNHYIFSHSIGNSC